MGDGAGFDAAIVSERPETVLTKPLTIFPVVVVDDLKGRLAGLKINRLYEKLEHSYILLILR